MVPWIMRFEVADMVVLWSLLYHDILCGIFEDVLKMFEVVGRE